MASNNKYSVIAMDNVNALCYISDPDTYELLYLNEHTKNAFGMKDDSEYVGKMCYSVLQGLDKPCDFCTNSRLMTEKVIQWDYHNLVLDRYYSLTDHLLNVDGKGVRLEFAIDVSEHRAELSRLEGSLKTEQTLVKCIQTLSDNIEIDQAIDNLLSHIGEYYKSERAYIFEFDFKNDIMNNTYEWCSDPSKVEIHNLQAVPLEYIARWIEKFETEGEFYITTLSEEADPNSEEYKTLSAQGITSLMAAPLLGVDGRIVGFIGVDDATLNLKNISLLRSVSLFVLNDITKRRMYETLEELNYTDTLTGLYNRTKYMERLRELESTPPSRLGIVYADINGLRPINETYGQQQGDFFIMRNALLLTEIFGKNVYRLGGDEFVVLTTSPTEEQFKSQLQALRAELDSSNECDMAIGTVFKSGKIDVLKELSYADELMSIDKQSYYSSTSKTVRMYKQGTIKSLLEELDRGQFGVYLQAKVDLESGKITGAEALVRKWDEDGLLIPPIKFIPIYEREKIVRHVDYFVIETVCKTLRQWMDEGNPIKISLNLSRVTFMEYNIIRDMKMICDRYNVPTELIDIEITESSNKIDNENLRERIVEAKHHGFSVSLDDFGAEYSNLLMLANMEFSQIKIDKSLIDHICDDWKSRTIVEYAIAMCKQLKMDNSLAEGVETEEQRLVLKSIGCRSGQGYLFAKPMALDDFYAKYKAQK